MLAILALFGLFLTSCLSFPLHEHLAPRADPTGSALFQGLDLLEKETNYSFQTLRKLLQQNQVYADGIEQFGTVTFFAPIDKAFAKPFKNGNTQDFIKYHLVNESLSFKTISFDQYTPINTILGPEIKTGRFANESIQVVSGNETISVVLDSARIRSVLIYVVSKLFVVPDPYPFFLYDPTLQQFKPAFMDIFTKLIAPYQDLTLLVPSQDAIKSTIIDNARIMAKLKSPKFAAELISNHIIPNIRLKDYDLTALLGQNVQTADNETLKVSLKGDAFTFKGFFGTTKVFATDVLIAKGGAHVIDKVIFPKSFLMC